MDARQERGQQLAQRGHIVKEQNGWKVLSQTGNGYYAVKLDNGPSCTCPDFELRQQKCKHLAFPIPDYNKHSCAFPADTL